MIQIKVVEEENLWMDFPLIFTFLRNILFDLFWSYLNSKICVVALNRNTQVTFKYLKTWINSYFPLLSFLHVLIITVCQIFVGCVCMQVNTDRWRCCLESESSSSRWLRKESLLHTSKLYFLRQETSQSTQPEHIF